MRDFLNVYDQNLKKVAVLQNAYSITETRELNKIYTLTFKMPASDEKNELIRPFNYVRWRNDGQLYRIVKPHPEDSETAVIEYECEHVITTLCNTVLFGSYIYGGASVRTEEVIKWLLSQQKTKLWQLGTCDFDQKFEYAWEQENLLNALYAIPKEFVDKYKWDFDTNTFPWILHLRKLDDTIKPQYYIRAKRNLIESSATIDYTNICTRLYPLGYGEGINQLTIKDVNGGKSYIQSSDELINKYGIIEKVLVDRRYENPESLLAYAQTILKSLEEPSMSREFKVVDLYPLTSMDIDNAEVGDLAKLTNDGTKAWITKVTHVYDDPGNLTIELSTNTENVADTIADLADRVRIESVYAQGATQLYQQSKDANATPEKGMILSLYFPSEMKQINKVLLNIELDSFRAYSQSTDADGGYADSTAAGGGTYDSTAGGGGTSNTNSSDFSFSGTIGTGTYNNNVVFTIPVGFGYSSSTSGPHGDLSGHIHTFDVRLNNVSLPISTSNFNHNHDVDLGQMGSHSHSFSLPDHTHGFSVPDHSHGFQIPNHTHEIKPGIYEYGSASVFDIYVNGKKKISVNSRSFEGDISKWLLDDSKRIPRDTWIRLEIRPNDLAYVISSVFVQGFVQSRGDSTY